MQFHKNVIAIYNRDLDLHTYSIRTKHSGHDRTKEIICLLTDVQLVQIIPITFRYLIAYE